jgi:cytochrome c
MSTTRARIIERTLQMKTTRLIVAGLALVCVGAFAATPEEIETKAGCLACHSKDKKIVGPAYKDVAAKYRGDKGAEARLFEKVKKGSQGTWGQVPMPPNASVPDADVRALVKWVLSQ